MEEGTIRIIKIDLKELKKQGHGDTCKKIANLVSALDEVETAIKDGEETPTFAKMPSLLKSKHKAFARGNRRKSLKFKTKKGYC